jgi:hypothetical protein
MNTSRRLRISDLDVALWDACEKARLPTRFEAAIPALVEQSGLDAEWWRESMNRALPFWIALVDGGLEVDAGSLRDLGTGVVANLVHAHLGKPIPADVTLEFDSRIAEEDDAGHRQVWSAIRHVVAGSHSDVPV